jgi:uncharacterized protein YkwD
MVKCDICGKELQLPFSCNYCSGTFCSEHRLPESHQCLNMPKEAPWHLRAEFTEKKQIQPMKKGKSGYPKPHKDEYVSEGKFHFVKGEGWTEKHKKRKNLRWVLLAFLAIIIVFAALFVIFQFPTSLSPSPSQPSIPSSSPNLSPSPSQPPTTQGQEELVEYVLALINSDRQSQGLQNVTLSSVDSAQLHADNMLRFGFFSHWDTIGYKPYVRYTLAGGKGAVSENCAAQLGYYSDIKEVLKDLEWNMMYDDASSNWGHRDNILNPFHNKVGIGIAYDSNNIYLVQDFENDYIQWSSFSITQNEATLIGSLTKQVTLSQVNIFYDNLPSNLTIAQLENSPYNGACTQGTFVGMALPSGYESTQGITITSQTWSQSGLTFHISFSLSQAFNAYGKGVYTIYLQSDNQQFLTTYSIWHD